MLDAGMRAPAFSLQDDAGQLVTLDDLLAYDANIVLYAYPRDNTPGCTKEACSFRDNFHRLRALGAVVVGVSPDIPEKHASFKKAHELPFILLGDPEKKLLTALGAWGEKILYGKKSMGVIRSTFIIDRSGTIVKVWKKVTPADHGAHVAEFLEKRSLA
ncbi:peroxiredoxin [Parasphaerochaeta coccoides]|uniref:thioredoxin-dependent peroxiredoxin n=1 Tax=Parasphaerochaeta coccoides (strain ATCC BAA-1237 / DSM 17374 / SPN1) TaxID=760011 RepID=F4GM19_PARC1|nr:peroxiredoxin [Parasphaerochaeta coccoides]AEC02494.1 alkyl hydroperoxide reductase/ Thiol specific antioxidant/ Mal allergen [Parasphaerochaeta coccoides DSM 17374]